MYKVLVVEDSKPIARNIVSIVKSVRRRFEIAGVAYNGDEALEKARGQRIDILVTDIKMPKMDGLELIDRVKKSNPFVKCIIISGYGDFEYTKQAIKLQIHEYLLKPIDAKELENALDKAADTIEKEQAAKHENYIYKLINQVNTNNDETFITGFDKFALIIIRVGISRKGPFILDKKNIYDCMKGLYSEDSLWVTDTAYASEKVIVINADRLSSHGINRLASGLFQNIKALYAQINIMVGPVVCGINKLHEKYEELSNVFSIGIVMEKSQLMEGEALHQTIDMNGIFSYTEFLGNKFGLFIKNRQSHLFRSELERCFKEWKDKSYPFIVVKRIIMMLLDKFYQAIEEKDESVYIDTEQEVDQMFYSAFTYSELLENVWGAFEKLFARLKKDRILPAKELIDDMKTYFQANIYNNVTMQELTYRYGMSSSYINRVFKKYCDYTPMDYFMERKIEEAKKMMDADKEILFKEISDILGFNDQHYFSKVFKAYTGYSPTEYKSSK